MADTGTILIPLTQGQVAIIDAADWPSVSQHSWWAVRSALGTYYAATKIRTADGRRRVVQLQRFLMGDPPGVQIDHASRDPLDNRRTNLRIATSSQNKANTPHYRRNASGFKGVYWKAAQRRWGAQIRVNGHLNWLGEYLSREEAARAYDRAAKTAFGEFARCNFED